MGRGGNNVKTVRFRDDTTILGLNEEVFQYMLDKLVKVEKIIKFKQVLRKLK